MEPNYYYFVVSRQTGEIVGDNNTGSLFNTSLDILEKWCPGFSDCIKDFDAINNDIQNKAVLTIDTNEHTYRIHPDLQTLSRFMHGWISAKRFYQVVSFNKLIQNNSPN